MKSLDDLSQDINNALHDLLERNKTSMWRLYQERMAFQKKVLNELQEQMSGDKQDEPQEKLNVDERGNKE